MRSPRRALSRSLNPPTPPLPRVMARPRCPARPRTLGGLGLRARREPRGRRLQADAAIIAAASGTHPLAVGASALPLARRGWYWLARYFGVERVR